MKHIIPCILVILLIASVLGGCFSQQFPAGGIAATTLPVYQFTSLLCQGTGIPVTRLINESVSCLHDYSLSVSQVKAVESADLVVISGGGMEAFMEDLLSGKTLIDASSNIQLTDSCQEEGHEGHHHEADPHIWLFPANAAAMAQTICDELCKVYPSHEKTFLANLQPLLTQLQDLQVYGQAQLSGLSCRELVTFHDGFSYFAHSFDLTILQAIEEESGSEASAKELIELIELVDRHHLPAVFIEENGSVSAADVISAETGAKIYTLSMAISGDDYFAAMYRNIDAVKEALV